LLAIGVVGIVFRVPLHSNNEFAASMFYCFDDVVWGACNYDEVACYFLQGLVMI
jgi:hypothetical protein